MFVGLSWTSGKVQVKNQLAEYILKAKKIFKIKMLDDLTLRSLFHGQNEDMHLEILEKLLELGADPNAYDIHGNTPLHHAMIQAQRRMTRVLLKHGANPNIDNRFFKIYFL